MAEVGKATLESPVVDNDEARAAQAAADHSVGLPPDQIDIDSMKVTQNYDAYTAENLQHLETLKNQLAIALSNAQLYGNMEALVAQRTEELEAKTLHLQKLLMMRREFLDIASHQLRTPISVIRGSVSMLLDGDYDDASLKKRRQLYAEIFDRTENCGRL